MKRVKNRALAELLLVAAVIIGLGVYIVRFAEDGERWATEAVNPSVYSGGALVVGKLTDRNEVMLAGITDGRRTFAENADVRRATLHAVGDAQGFIGTGALSVFAPQLAGYNAITGAYSRTGEGGTVALTVDSRLNVEAMRALDGRRGAVMVMDYTTGEVLCMVSGPTFDTNSPPSIVDGDPAFEGIYLNRGLSAAYTPGSTFKLLTAAAAIENIDGISERKFDCKGSISVGDGTINCPRAHGEVSFGQALAVSCNGMFAELSLELGADTLARYVKMYGLSESTTVGGVTTAKGSFDKAEPGTDALAWSGIGQYTNTVCPAAMLRFAGAVANDGMAVPMRLTQKIGAALFTPGERLMKSDTAERLGEMMSFNVSESYGEKNFQGLTLHAKSGTAEVGGGASPHAWFTGYISNEDCPLAFVVVIENGGGGAAVAGPVANRALQAALLFLRPAEAE